MALEVSVRPTLDHVWVVSEPATTGAQYNENLTIATSTWQQLSALRSLHGGYPIARLDTDVLAAFPGRVIIVDDKAGTQVPDLLRLLGSYGGPSRIIVKAYWQQAGPAIAARAAGYQTLGYYYSNDLSGFDRTEASFSILSLNVGASRADFRRFEQTGKIVLAHVIATRAQARLAWRDGANGLIVSAVDQVVPRSG